MIEAQVHGPLKAEAIALLSAMAVLVLRLAAWIASWAMAKGSKRFQKATFEFGDVRLTVARRTRKSSRITSRRKTTAPSTDQGSDTSQEALPLTEPSEPLSATSQRSVLTDLPSGPRSLDFDSRFDAY